MGEVYEHKCPSCGGSLVFDAKTQLVTCPYCDTVLKVEELQDKDTVTIDVNENLNTNAGEEWGDEAGDMHEYHCESCGGEIYCDENTSATMCPYCGNNVILKGRLSGSLRPDAIIPFKKSLDDAKAAFKEVAKGKLFAPKNFIDDTRVEEIKGMYVPYWLYDADLYADITYKAMIEHRWREGDYEVVENEYYSVVRQGGLGFKNVPVDGSSKLDDTMMESIEPFDHNEAVEFQSVYLSGYLTDKYDVENEDAVPRAVERMRNSTEEMFMDTVCGYDAVVPVSSNLRFTDSSSSYVLHPVWLLTAKFKEKIHHFAMNGETGKMVGNLPRDDKKAFLMTFGVLILALALSLVIACATSGKFTVVNLAISVAVGAVAAGIFFFIFNNQLKGIRPDDYARNYYVAGSMHVDVAHDLFLYRTKHRYRVNDKD